MVDEQHIIRFILHSKLVEIDFSKEKAVNPHTTVLNWLRSKPDHKGVKEGCAEGDCGACTVVLADLDENDELHYRAVNSCLLFLPMIHGKQLITVEDLTQRKGDKFLLHPVQQALVEHYGSQCGYCTPGIVMSMFALFKNHSNPSKKSIKDALSGNLCRCTGYEPIINAAVQACKNDGHDHFSLQEEETIELLKDLRVMQHNLFIVSEKQTWYKPASFTGALFTREQHPEAYILSGATDLAIACTKKGDIHEKVLDISDLAELKEFSYDEDALYIGSGVSLEKIRHFVADKLQAMHEMLEVFGSLQIRNLATLGGNIATASPIGDLLPVLIAHKASIILKSYAHERMVTVESMIKGYRETDIYPDEIIYLVVIPRPEENVKISAYKVSKRKDVDISSVSVAFRLETDKENMITEFMAVYGGVAAMIKRAVMTEAALIGKAWTKEAIEEAMETLYEEFSPISDARADEESRRIMAKNLLMKFYNDTQ